MTRVVFSQDSPHVARAVGFWPMKRVIVGMQWMELPPAERAAVLQHEIGHCRAFHLEQRCALLAIVAAPSLFWLPWNVLLPVAASVLIWEMAAWRARQHEFEADRFAAAQGHGPALAAYLARAPEIPSDFYPSHADRIAAITRVPREEPCSSES